MHPPIMNADKTGKKSPPVPKGNKYSCWAVIQPKSQFLIEYNTWKPSTSKKHYKLSSEETAFNNYTKKKAP